MTGARGYKGAWSMTEISSTRVANLCNHKEDEDPASISSLNWTCNFFHDDPLVQCAFGALLRNKLSLLWAQGPACRGLWRHKYPSDLLQPPRFQKSL
eukprot:9323990-Pyramimonas_sp.AAC.1